MDNESEEPPHPQKHVHRPTIHEASVDFDMDPTVTIPLDGSAPSIPNISDPSNFPPTSTRNSTISSIHDTPSGNANSISTVDPIPISAHRHARVESGTDVFGGHEINNNEDPGSPDNVLQDWNQDDSTEGTTSVLGKRK